MLVLTKLPTIKQGSTIKLVISKGAHQKLKAYSKKSRYTMRDIVDQLILTQLDDPTKL